MLGLKKGFVAAAIVEMVSSVLNVFASVKFRALPWSITFALTATERE